MDENVAAFAQLGKVMLNAVRGFEAAGFSRREALLLGFEFIYRKVEAEKGSVSHTEMMDEALRRFLGQEKKPGEENPDG